MSLRLPHFLLCTLLILTTQPALAKGTTAPPAMAQAQSTASPTYKTLLNMRGCRL